MRSTLTAGRLDADVIPESRGPSRCTGPGFGQPFDAKIPHSIRHEPRSESELYVVMVRRVLTDGDVEAIEEATAGKLAEMVSAFSLTIREARDRLSAVSSTEKSIASTRKKRISKPADNRPRFNAVINCTARNARVGSDFASTAQTKAPPLAGLSESG